MKWIPSAAMILGLVGGIGIHEGASASGVDLQTYLDARWVPRSAVRDTIPPKARYAGKVLLGPSEACLACPDADQEACISVRMKNCQTRHADEACPGDCLNLATDACANICPNCQEESDFCRNDACTQCPEGDGNRCIKHEIDFYQRCLCSDPDEPLCIKFAKNHAVPFCENYCSDCIRDNNGHCF